MNKLLLGSIIFGITIITAFTLKPTKDHAMKGNEIEFPPKKNAPKDVKWLSMEEALKLCEKKPKKIFVDVYTDWCGWCKKMDKSTLQDPKIVEYLGTNFYSVKLDAESKKKLMYKGKEMTEEQLATRVYKASGFPTTVYLDEKQNLLQPISGYLEVEMLNKILHYYGGNHYKNTSWEKFEADFNADSN